MNDDHEHAHDAEHWQDRALDSALHELHGSRPPDLSARVLLALQEQPAGDLPRLRRRRTAPLVAYLAAAAMFLLALAVAYYGFDATGGPAGEQRVAQIEITVAEGTLVGLETAAGHTTTTAIAAGDTRPFLLRAGNRLQNTIPSRARLDVFGTIATGPETELEVHSMEFTAKNGVVAASALTLSVVAGVVTWHSLTRTETAVAGEVVRMEAQPDTTAQLAAENARLRERLAELERQNESLRSVREEAKVEAKPQEPHPKELEEPEVAASPVFEDPRYADALAKVDWKVVGEVTRDMQPLLVELVKTMEETGEVSTELAVKIQQLNPQLVAQLPAILESGMPGYGANGAYTHPLFVANSLAATLAASGDPLNGAQNMAIAGIVRAFTSENEAIAAQQHEFAIEGLVAETEMKERFYKELSTRLTPEQFAKIYPEGSTDYDGVSLFSTSLMTRPFTSGVPARDAAEFARQASSRLGGQLELDEATTEKVRTIVEEMSAQDASLWEHPASTTETRLNMLRAGRTTAALRHQIAVLRAINRQVALTAEQREKLSKMRGVLVPLPR